MALPKNITFLCGQTIWPIQSFLTNIYYIHARQQCIDRRDGVHAVFGLIVLGRKRDHGGLCRATGQSGLQLRDLRGFRVGGQGATDQHPGCDDAR